MREPSSSRAAKSIDSRSPVSFPDARRSSMKRKMILSRLRVGIDARAVKRRLRQAPLPQPEISFACQQTVAEQLFVLTQNSSLDEFAVVRHEHLFDVVGMADEIDAKVVIAHGHDVAIVAHE